MNRLNANIVQERRPCWRSLDDRHERTEIGTLLQGNAPLHVPPPNVN